MTWAGLPLSSSSSTTKTSPKAVSSTGVDVIPTVGLMLPHGRSPLGTGVPTVVDHKTEPVLAASAVTVSASVATYTLPVASSGSP